ncbi:MAG: GNAT family N-acetyltransferase [Coriobacteriales bacterium]
MSENTDINERPQVAVRAYEDADLPAMARIWNKVVEDGRAFPQDETLSPQEAAAFFAAQTFTGVAVVEGRVAGLYILHPNDIGRKGHIANASYAVDALIRGCGIGRALVAHSLAQLAPCGFRGLQFNAVVASNLGAIHLYESLGFMRIGTIPGGYRNINNEFEDMHIYFHEA